MGLGRGRQGQIIVRSLGSSGRLLGGGCSVCAEREVIHFTSSSSALATVQDTEHRAGQVGI